VSEREMTPKHPNLGGRAVGLVRSVLHEPSGLGELPGELTTTGEPVASAMSQLGWHEIPSLRRATD
jgi:hypothetical protein